ncbi:MAG: 2-dehydropantoate 2-reductase [Halioglobus sp.]|jgi:2-dehydropantoate 2-reductase
MSHSSWHVLGAGAMGSLFASSLHKSGAPVTLLRRPESGQSRTQVVRIDEGDRTREMHLPVSYNNDCEPIDHLLICTKAYDVRNALGQVAHRLNENSCALIVVNGMGFMDEVNTDFPNLQFALGTTTEGVYRRGNGHFCHAGLGITRLGKVGLIKPPPWFDDWARIDQACAWEPNIEEILWQKLAINCAINPLSALSRCENGMLLEKAELASQVDLVCQEISLVSRAAGYIHTATNIHSEVASVIANTANNRSSMLADVLAGRRSENDYISGYLLKIAAHNGILTPHNKTLFERIRLLDDHAYV